MKNLELVLLISKRKLAAVTAKNDVLRKTVEIAWIIEQKADVIVTSYGRNKILTK